MEAQKFHKKYKLEKFEKVQIISFVFKASNLGNKIHIHFDKYIIIVFQLLYARSSIIEKLCPSK